MTLPEGAARDAIESGVYLQRVDVRAGDVRCTAFHGVPEDASTVMTIVAADSAAAQDEAAALEAALTTALLGLGLNVRSDDGACRGPTSPMFWCAAGGRFSRQLLLIIGDSAAPFTWEDDRRIRAWSTRGGTFSVLPMLPVGSHPEHVFGVFGDPVTRVNVLFWGRSAADVAQDVVALAVLPDDERRVFVSYRRPETLGIAEQLFTALAQARFDVFVDRFRIAPGVNVQERLTDELAHKGTVLVLESATLLTSPWVEHELLTARLQELGRIAVHFPGGPMVPWIDPDHRVDVDAAELVLPPGAAPAATVTGTVTAAHEVAPAAVDRIVAAVVREHALALFRRRAMLIDSMRLELTKRRVRDQRLDPAGHLHVRVSAAGRTREYVLWASPRPPAIDAFRRAHGVCDPSPGTPPAGPPAGAIFTPALYGERGRRERFEWLAARSGVRLRDVSRLAAVADCIARGEDIP